MTWVDFVSQVQRLPQIHRTFKACGAQWLLLQMGGLLGLCMGFSICSGFEIIYWFIFRMWAEHTSQSRPTKVQQATSFISNWAGSSSSVLLQMDEWRLGTNDDRLDDEGRSKLYPYHMTFFQDPSRWLRLLIWCKLTKGFLQALLSINSLYPYHIFKF